MGSILTPPGLMGGNECRCVLVCLLQMEVKRVFILILFRESFKSKKYKETMLI